MHLFIRYIVRVVTFCVVLLLVLPCFVKREIKKAIGISTQAIKSDTEKSELPKLCLLYGDENENLLKQAQPENTCLVFPALPCKTRMQLPVVYNTEGIWQVEKVKRCFKIPLFIRNRSIVV